MQSRTSVGEFDFILGPSAIDQILKDAYERKKVKTNETN